MKKVLKQSHLAQKQLSNIHALAFNKSLFAQIINDLFNIFSKKVDFFVVPDTQESVFISSHFNEN